MGTKLTKVSAWSAKHPNVTHEIAQYVGRLAAGGTLMGAGMGAGYLSSGLKKKKRKKKVPMVLSQDSVEDA